MTPFTCWLHKRKLFSSSLIVRECVSPDLDESLFVEGRVAARDAFGDAISSAGEPVAIVEDDEASLKEFVAEA
jgi:hypothetical protein